MPTSDIEKEKLWYTWTYTHFKRTRPCAVLKLSWEQWKFVPQLLWNLSEILTVTNSNIWSSKKNKYSFFCCSNTSKKVVFEMWRMTFLQREFLTEWELFFLEIQSSKTFFTTHIKSKVNIWNQRLYFQCIL